MSNVRQVNSFLSQTNSYLKEFLHARGVVCGREKHAELAEKCFWAAKLDLQVKPTDREAERDISNVRAEKLSLDGGCVNLPWPQTLTSGWEESPASLPDIDRFSIETYLKTVGWKLGLIKTEGRATLGLGKGLYLSGHVTDLRYHGISPNINYCFVRGKSAVRMQTYCSSVVCCCGSRRKRRKQVMYLF
ncbi:hypothetical protein HOLleu_36584 [Holothuria leucospilota]|uniref:Uncharacterized protein n=1 Tax=Holothuria leucospilota TaxID=206669 RepID=A0A9Q1BFS1_HOLLE|nr:hypothetical protein HOLleu_36584 [Holothuria leucospilota]